MVSTYRVKDIDGVALHDIRADELAIYVPRGERASFNSVVQRTRHIVGILTGTLLGLGGSEVLVALVRLDVELYILGLTILTGELD